MAIIVATGQVLIANEKENNIKVLIGFDRNLICCLMNHDTLEEKLEAIEGIDKAEFNERRREVLVTYNEKVIGIDAIVEITRKITDVDKEVMLPPVKK
jgi:copper chaperone CopZ